jgi:aspartyl protease family protein
MPTGFIDRYSSALALLVAAAPAWALDVQLIGTFGDQAAVLSIDGGTPKTVRTGQKFGSVTVISVEKERATVEIDGKKRVLTRGQHYRGEGAAGASDRQSVTLAADGAGHFFTDGAINGSPVRFLVDTGATLIALPARDAVRMGIDYRKGPRGTINTANGTTTAYGVRFDRVKLGGIELTSIDGVVIEQGLDVALLGMSFLNRVEMFRSGETMTLKRRF